MLQKLSLWIYKLVTLQKQPMILFYRLSFSYNFRQYEKKPQVQQSTKNIKILRVYKASASNHSSQAKTCPLRTVYKKI